MSIEIRSSSRVVSLLGASLQHDPSKRYGEEVRVLMDRYWPILKGQNVRNEGINWVVYERGGRLFAGVEAPGADEHSLQLERSAYDFDRHAVWKHVGPYHRLGEAYTAMLQGLGAQGLRADWPRAEVYGHWNKDESKLETEIWMRLA